MIIKHLIIELFNRFKCTYISQIKYKAPWHSYKNVPRSYTFDNQGGKYILIQLCKLILGMRRVKTKTLQVPLPFWRVKISFVRASHGGVVTNAKVLFYI